MNNEIQQIEKEIAELTKQLGKLRADAPAVEIKNYVLKDTNGDVTLLELFGTKDRLFAIHNMGQGCRYCTLWADGLNGFLPHLEDRFAVALLSKDAPEDQRRFGNSRGWRFNLVSHAGGEYIQEQSVGPGANQPGLVCYERKGDKIFRRNSAAFGPGDLFCSIWHVLALGGLSEENWFPQFSYWKRPQALDDGGKNAQ